MRIAPIFKDGMVLQRERINRIWGRLEDGETGNLSVEFLGKKYDAIINGRDWYADIDSVEAGGPYEMIIECDNQAGKDDNRIKISDILVGEVWFAGGQSNMELELQNSEHGIAVVHSVDYDRIRFYNTPKYPTVDEGLDEAEANTRWRYVRGDDSREMSAVAFYFAKKLYETLNVPVGIIDCYIGGTSVTCWIPKEDTIDLKKGEKAVRDYIEEWENDINNTPPEKYQADLDKYNKEVDEWNKRTEALKKENPDIRMEEINEKAGLYPWPPPRGGASQYRPFGIYESMVSRVKPYGIRGFIYYQGEEDQDRPDSYAELNTRLIKRWRGDFSLDEFVKYPFFITQLPMYVEKGSEDAKKFTYIREQQATVKDADDTVGMAVITDCGEYDNIHPIDKNTPGTRLAVQVLGKVYNKISECENMHIDSVSYEGSSAVLIFKNTYGEIHFRPTDPETLTAKLEDKEIPVGKIVTDSEKLSLDKADLSSKDLNSADSDDKQGKIYGFEVSGDGNNFVTAKVTPDGTNLNSLRVSGVGIDNIKAVRYAYFDYGVANVYNAVGLPLQMFSDER